METHKDLPEFSTCSPEQIAQMVLEWSTEEVASKLAQLTPQQLEAAGKNLSLTQSFALLDYAADADPQFHWKLSPLLVGMPHTLFSQILLAASPRQLNVLKMEAMTEPVQHHLTLLTHEVTHQLPQVIIQLDKVSTEISLIPISSPESVDLNELKRQLRAQVQWYDAALKLINKVLILAWNTNRTDLIDKLSHAKEWCQRNLYTTVGQPTTPFGKASGLFAKLEENLAAVFGNPNSLTDFEAADDDEPAIEGLSKFSLWYLHDYQQIGLLPTLADPLLLDLDPAKHSEQERLQYREKLMDEVRQNLAKIGLETVKDLKAQGIISTDALRAYIAENLR